MPETSIKPIAELLRKCDEHERQTEVMNSVWECDLDPMVYLPVADLRHLLAEAEAAKRMREAANVVLCRYYVHDDVDHEEMRQLQDALTPPAEKGVGHDE